MNNNSQNFIELCGGPTRLAAQLTIATNRKKQLTAMAVRQWLKRGVPAEYCIPIEKATNGQVKRHQLRPDIYPPEEYSLIDSAIEVSQ